MNRRAAVQALGLVLAAYATALRAQRRDGIAVVGVPLIAAGRNDPILAELRLGLQERGYVEGQSIRIEVRSAEGNVERLPALLHELVQLKVDVIVAGAEPIVRAARQATSTIPIVTVGRDYDPVAAGFVESLSRPGGNVTGVHLFTGETAGKRLEPLKELLPRLSRVAVLYDSSIFSGKRQFEETESAARALSLAVQAIALGAPYDYDAAFKQ